MQKNEKDVRGDESGNFKRIFLLILATIMLGMVALFVLDWLLAIKVHWTIKSLLLLIAVAFILTAEHEKKKIFREKRLANKILQEEGLEPLKE